MVDQAIRMTAQIIQIIYWSLMRESMCFVMKITVSMSTKEDYTDMITGRERLKRLAVGRRNILLLSIMGRLTLKIQSQYTGIEDVVDGEVVFITVFNKSNFNNFGVYKINGLYGSDFNVLYDPDGQFESSKYSVNKVTWVSNFHSMYYLDNNGNPDTSKPFTEGYYYYNESTYIYFDASGRRVNVAMWLPEPD